MSSRHNCSSYVSVYTAVTFVTASISNANAGYIGSGPQPRAYTTPLSYQHHHFTENQTFMT